MADPKVLQVLLKLVQHEKSIVALTTVSGDGSPSTTLNPEIVFESSGRVLYREYLESSATNRNLVYALWFNKGVLLAVSTGGQTYELHGTPTYAHVTGALFQEHYESAQAEDPNADLATLWEIRIDEIVDVSSDLLRRQQDLERPFFRHLDRLVTPAS